MPDGTMIFHQDTEELIGEITPETPKILVAQGGKGGLGTLDLNLQPIKLQEKTPRAQNLNKEIYILNSG